MPSAQFAIPHLPFRVGRGSVLLDPAPPDRPALPESRPLSILLCAPCGAADDRSKRSSLPGRARCETNNQTGTGCKIPEDLEKRLLIDVARLVRRAQQVHRDAQHTLVVRAHQPLEGVRDRPAGLPDQAPLRPMAPPMWHSLSSAASYISIVEASTMPWQRSRGATHVHRKSDIKLGPN